jgi:hypothetical protein
MSDGLPPSGDGLPPPSGPLESLIFGVRYLMRGVLQYWETSRLQFNPADFGLAYDEASQSVVVSAAGGGGGGGGGALPGVILAHSYGDNGFVVPRLTDGGRVAAFFGIGDTAYGAIGIEAPPVGTTERVVFLGSNTSITSFVDGSEEGAAADTRARISTPTGKTVKLRGGQLAIFDHAGTFWRMHIVDPASDAAALSGTLGYRYTGQSDDGAPVVLAADIGVTSSFELPSGFGVAGGNSTYVIRATCTARAYESGGHAAALVYTLLVKTDGTVATVIAAIPSPDAAALANGETYTLGFTVEALSQRIVATFTGTEGQTVYASLNYEIVSRAGE